MSKYKGLIFALEEAEVVEEVPAEVVEVPAEVEAGAAEVVESEADVSDLNGAIDDASEDLGTLEEIGEVLSDSVEAGEGVDQPAAAIAEIAVESICRRLGIRNPKVIPAMESFGSKTSRVTATRIAVEGITETLKKGWEAVVAWLKNLYEKIKGFFVKLFDQNLRLEKAATALKASVSALDGAAVAKEKDLANKSIAVAFGGKGAAGVEKILAAQTKLTEGMVSSFGTVIEAVNGIDKGVGELAEKKDASQTLFAAGVKAGEAYVGAAKLFPEAKVSKNGLKTSVVAGPFVNGFELKIETETAKETGKLSLSVSFEQKEVKAAEKVAVLSREEMAKVVDEVLGLTKATADYKEGFAKIEEIGKASIKLVGDVISGLEKISSAAGEKGSGAKALAEVRASVQTVNAAAVKFGSRLPSVNVTAGKLALNYVSASLAQYKAPAAAK